MDTTSYQTKVDIFNLDLLRTSDQEWFYKICYEKSIQIKCFFSYISDKECTEIAKIQQTALLI